MAILENEISKCWHRLKTRWSTYTHVLSYVLKLYIPVDIRRPLLYKRMVLTIYITADDALEHLSFLI
jgi:hypothetical protein